MSVRNSQFQVVICSEVRYQRKVRFWRTQTMGMSYERYHAILCFDVAVCDTHRMHLVWFHVMHVEAQPDTNDIVTR